MRGLPLWIMITGGSAALMLMLGYPYHAAITYAVMIGALYAVCAGLERLVFGSVPDDTPEGATQPRPMYFDPEGFLTPGEHSRIRTGKAFAERTYDRPQNGPNYRRDDVSALLGLTAIAIVVGICVLMASVVVIGLVILSIYAVMHAFGAVATIWIVAATAFAWWLAARYLPTGYFPKGTPR